MPKGEDFFKEQNDEFSGGGGRSFSGSPSERTPMIEKVFKEVLGRKPSSRELAYYKYGILKEDEIRVKLLKSDEHKNLIKDAKRVPNLEEEVKNLKVSEKKLIQNSEDLKGEMINAQTLLDEKNLLIKDLRGKVSNPYDLPSHVEKYEEGFDVYSAKRVNTSTTSKRSLYSILEEIVNILFK